MPLTRFPFPLWIVGAVGLCGALLLFFIFHPLAPSPPPVFWVDSIANCDDLNRDSYGLSPTVFAALPPSPKCFNSIVALYREKQFVDINFFDSSYYLQPEFYPAFLSSGLAIWRSPLDTHYGVVGHGSYPSSSSVKSSFPSETFFLIYSGYGVRTLQSVSLRAEFENPSDANLFSVSFDENTSHGFLLGPTFPKFHSAWVHPVIVRVTPLFPFESHSGVIRIHTTRSNSDFSSNPLLDFFPLYDSTDYVGENLVYRLTIGG